MKWVSHLSKAEYIDLGYVLADNADNFDDMETQAQRQIDAVTNYYYRDHDIESDDWPARVDAYKAAICEQIEFILQTGISASYINGDDFKSVSIGRLSLTPAITATRNGTVNGVCKEAYRLLGHYGLLYRGVNDYASKNKQASM